MVCKSDICFLDFYIFPDLFGSPNFLPLSSDYRDRYLPGCSEHDKNALISFCFTMADDQTVYNGNNFMLSPKCHKRGVLLDGFDRFEYADAGVIYLL